jgi:PKD repeat protein
MTAAPIPIHLRRMAALGVAALLGAGVASASPDAHFTATPIQGPVCVAPCAVHFDAIGDGQSETTDPAYPRAFHSLVFQWDFGDPSAGVWSVSGVPKNGALGAIAGHLFEVPGIHPVELTVTNPLGESDSVQTSITVADPNAHFATSDTWCFANSGTPGGAGFEACPVASATRHVVIGAAIAGGFDLALGPLYCGAGLAKKRCLFRAGDSFQSLVYVSLSGAAGAGLLSRFGAGADPRVVGGQGFAVVRNGWTISGFDVEVAGTLPLFRIPQQEARVTVAHTRGRNLRAHCIVTDTGDAAVHNDLLAVFEIDCQATVAAEQAGLFVRAERTLVMGNVLDNDYGGQFVLRTVHFPHSLIEHNRLMRPKSDPADPRNVMQLRAWAGNANGAQIGPTPTPTAFVVVSDNVFAQDNAVMVIRTCQSNDCLDDPRARDFQDVIFERNFFYYTDGGQQGRMQYAFWIQGGDITIRDNIFDLQGIESGDSPNSDRLLEQAENLAGSPGLDDDRIHVLNNLVYFDEAFDRPFRICQSRAAGSGHQCRNNLVAVPNHDGDWSIDDGHFLSSNNLFLASNPFIGPIPDQGLSRPGDFQLAGDAPVVDAGYAYGSEAAGTWTDFGRRCRPADGPDADTTPEWDIGPWEFDAADCLATPEPSVALLGCVAVACLAALRRSACRA